jgi:hypothetical protein
MVPAYSTVGIAPTASGGYFMKVPGHPELGGDKNKYLECSQKMAYKLRMDEYATF